MLHSKSKLNMYAIGTVSRPYGVRGQFKFKPFIEHKRRLLTLKKIFIGPNEKDAKQYEMTEVRFSRDGVILRLLEITNREAAKMLHSQYLFVSEADVVKPPEDHYYIHDIVGCTAMNGRKKLGEIIDVHRRKEGYAQDIWVVEGEPEIWIPVLSKYIKKVDLKKKKIAFQDVEGFLPE
jgi:16S rRNA processing protein RimM